MVVLNENAGRITADDIMPMDEYKKIRKEHRRSLIQRKLARRVHVGPFVLFHFENYITLWSQIQEMLFIEGGGDEQINDEIEAYNPLLPDGNELVARRFADKNNYPVEYVHECFSILSPYYKSTQKPFVKDELDELYGFPKSIEESSLIFLNLGRRDVKLEYSHKVLKAHPFL